MNKMGLAVIGISFTTLLFAHEEGREPFTDCSQLVGDWAVFCPKNTKKRDCPLDEDAELHIQGGVDTGVRAVYLEDDSRLEVPDPSEFECDEARLNLQVAAKRGGRDVFLCIQRVTSVLDLARRKGQSSPNPRQVGIQVVGDAGTCWSAGPKAKEINPGHSHADD